MTARKPRVVVIGGTYIDMAVRCEQIPSAGQNVAGAALSYSPAGPGPCQAAQAALCGCGVYLVSKIGSDPFGEMVKTALTEYDVDTQFVRVAQAKNTGVVVTLVSATGENATCRYVGANSALVPEDIDSAEDAIAAADVCLISAEGGPQDAIVRAILRAKVHGRTVILNPARPLRSQAGGELPIEYFSVDILVTNLFEAAEITETSAAGVRTAKLVGSELVARGVKYAVITMGKRGCMVVDRDGADQIPAFEVALVDDTGRGDAFAGALAASCAVGDDVRKAVKFASAAGALACTKFGAIEALPKKAEIIELLQKEGIDALPGDYRSA
jgi:ribokinase